MNDVSKSISELLSDAYGKTITIGGRVYVVKAPSIKVIARATQYLSQVDLPEKATMQELMKVVLSNSDNLAKGLSYLAAGDTYDYKQKSDRFYKEMLSGTHEELLQAYMIAFELIAGRDFFQCASLAMELAKLIVRPRS